MTCKNKITQLFLSMAIGLTFLTALIPNAHADSYPTVTLDAGEGTSIQLTSQVLVAPGGIPQVCNEAVQNGAINYDWPCADSQNCLALKPQQDTQNQSLRTSPGAFVFSASCPHAAGDVQWGANLNFNILINDSVVGSCTVGAFWDDDRSGNGSTQITDTNGSGVFQASQCTNGYKLEVQGVAEQTAEIVLSSEFNIYDGGGFDIYACVYHLGDKNGYCSSDYATLWSSATVDGTMQPAGGLKAGDGICIAASIGYGQYANYYFTLEQDASTFQVDGYPLEAYGTVGNPQYYIYPQYSNLVTSQTANGYPAISYKECDLYPGNTIWVDGAKEKEKEKEKEKKE